MPDVTITPSQDGPYLVSGLVRLTDAGGREIARPSQDASGAHRAQAGSAIRPWTEHVGASRHDYYV
jgi:hypothetical protein